MKIYFIFALIALGFISTSAFDDRKLTFDEWFSDVSAKYQGIPSDHPFSRQINTIRHKRYCMNNAVVYWRIKSKKLNYTEAMILIYGSAISCLEDKDKLDTLRQMIKSLVDFYSTTIQKEHIECFKMELQKIDPNSYLLKRDNFNTASMTLDKDTCTEIVDNEGLDDHILKFENQFGSLLTLSCENDIKNEIKKILLNIVILSDPNIYEHIKKYGIRTTTESMQKKLNAAFDCVKNKI
ncbi:hypothetical protein ACKWTF_014219 [Chironomus riparius]